MLAKPTKKWQNIWATFAQKLVDKAFQKDHSGPTAELYPLRDKRWEGFVRQNFVLICKNYNLVVPWRGGVLVSVIAFYSDDQSSNSAVVEPMPEDAQHNLSSVSMFEMA